MSPNIAWSFLVIRFLKLIGIGVSVLLLIKGVNANNQFIKSICKIGGEDGCKDILNSNASKITKWLNWSEVGFYYFTGSFLAILLCPTSLILIKWLNLLALPYTLYSISYQYRYKSWCVLCCTVQAILIAEAVTFNLFMDISFSGFDASLNNIGILILSFLLPVLAWSHLKPLYLSKLELPIINQQLNKYKFNTKLFHEALKAQPKYSISDQISPITIGNPTAENTITLVSNPFCAACSYAHQMVEKLINENANIKLNIIFSVKNKDEDRPTLAARHLISINLLNNHELTANAVNEWFRMKTNDYESWAKKFPVEINLAAIEIIKSQKKLCELAEVFYTPVAFINGHKLPSPYKLEDLKYLLE